MNLIRKRLIVEGDLFNSGYRCLVRFYARKSNIKGFIRHLPDDTMEIVCEGTPQKMKQFRKAIKIRGDLSNPLDFYVISIHQRKAPMDEKFDFFEIRYCHEMTPHEKEMDRLGDMRMLTISWWAHKDWERAQAEKRNNKAARKCQGTRSVNKPLKVA